LWEQSTNAGTDWTPASLTNNAQNYQAPALLVPTQYRRYVTSGANACCKSTSNILDISIDPLPGVPYAGPSETIFSIQNLYHMKADPPLENETGEWALISGSWDPEDITAYDTEVRNLSTDRNIFSWTVTLDNCSLTDTVTVTLLDDFVPEGFSPNGDGTNDTFIIEGLDQDDNYIDLSIVNGAGTEVFATSNRSEWEDWNGKNSKGLDLPEGTYYYLLKLTPKDPSDGTETQKKKGFIVLKRY
jgi:gliding motility-associated-like protein